MMRRVGAMVVVVVVVVIAVMRERDGRREEAGMGEWNKEKE